MTLEAADCFAGALSLLTLSTDEESGALIYADLSDGNSVQGGVEFAVAMSIQTVARAIAGGGWERRDSNMHSKCRLISKARRSTGLSDQSGGRENAAAGKVEQFRGKQMHKALNLTLQEVDLGAEGPTVHNELTGNLCAHANQRVKLHLQSIEPATAAQSFGRDILAQSQVVKMPAQPVLQTSALPHKIVTMIEQQPKILLCASKASQGQTGFPPSGLGHRTSVDGIRLPAASRAAPDYSHELGRHANDLLPFRKEKALKRSGDMTTVLHREPAFLIERTGPFEQAGEACATGSNRELGRDGANRCVNRHGRVRRLVWANTDYDHFVSLVGGHEKAGSLADSSQSGSVPRSY
jgi:hypothetical protein